MWWQRRSLNLFFMPLEIPKCIEKKGVSMELAYTKSTMLNNNLYNTVRRDHTSRCVSYHEKGVKSNPNRNTAMFILNNARITESPTFLFMSHAFSMMQYWYNGTKEILPTAQGGQKPANIHHISHRSGTCGMFHAVCFTAFGAVMFTLSFCEPAVSGVCVCAAKGRG